MEEKKKKEKEEEEKEPPDPGEEEWSLEDTERLLTYMSRVFMLQFPLYLAAKQAGSRLDDLSQAEATSLAVFLDVSGDVADIPLVLLRTYGEPEFWNLRMSAISCCILEQLCGINPKIDMETFNYNYSILIKS